MFTDKVLLVRPCNFGYNAETEETNLFQKQSSLLPSEIQKSALKEFETFVEILSENKISTEIVDDTPIPPTPDSIFPNNWFSTHENGIVILYPMLAKNRRNERNSGLVQLLSDKYGYQKIIDLSHFEDRKKYLEGTGSMVFDHQHKLCYVNISSRSNPDVAEEVCKILGYDLIKFFASDGHGNEIYHTNVLMGIGNRFAIICSEAIHNSAERAKVLSSLRGSGLEIVGINFEQMNSFCGNALQLSNSEGEKMLVMSTAAFKALSVKQRAQLQRHTKIVHSDLSTIESIGGGSARCMLAEVRA